MSKLIITRGLPGSGKTTWAMQQPGVKVCRDDLRSQLFGPENTHTQMTHEQEVAVNTAEEAQVGALLRKGYTVIEHSMNLRSRYVRSWLELADRCGAAFEVKDLTDVDLDVCLGRDFDREHSVGSKVVLELHQKFVHKKPHPLPVPEVKHKYEPYVRPDRRVRCIIVDIDGTVACNDGHRGWYEYNKVADDKYHDVICDLVNSLAWVDTRLVFLSGRSEDCRKATEEWLDQMFTNYCLYMRASGDHRDDTIVKYELFDKHLRSEDIWFVLDDRDRVVKMWRELGLKCLQVAEGNF